MMLIIHSDELKTKEKSELFFIDLHRKKKSLMRNPCFVCVLHPKTYKKKTIFLSLYSKEMNAKHFYIYL